MKLKKNITMKNAIKILGILFFVNIIISCGDNKNDKNTAERDANTLTKDQAHSDAIKKAPLFNSVAEDFKFNNEVNLPLNITSLTISKNMHPGEGDEILHEEVATFIGENQLVFTASDNEGSFDERSNQERFEIVKKGMMKIGDNSYDASLYYTDYSIESRIEFQGIIVVSLSIIKSLPEGELIILTKGRIE